MMSRLPLRLQQALILAVGILLAGAMVLLGIWQLDVYRQQGAAASARRAAAPPVALSEAAPAGAAITDGFGRSITFTGTYDPTLQLLVANSDGRPGVRVLTGLRQADGSVVPVVRGLVPESPASTGPTSTSPASAGPGSIPPAAPAPPTEPVTQTGVLLPSEDSADPGPGGLLTSVRLPLLAQTWPSPLVGGFVTLSAPDAQAQGLTPAVVALPESSGRLRNGAYAVQWWLFAAFAVGMAVRMARDVGLGDQDLTELDADSAPEPT